MIVVRGCKVGLKCILMQEIIICFAIMIVTYFGCIIDRLYYYGQCMHH
jgi:hypothetical protein